ncbi:hypothetical protein M9782_07745 [Pectobacterium actinidiae]|uniref:hypothetical protein n=1 Tax=Pectobacterium actinidiae TaxID=1507808 RepID=UPI0023AA4201|nr:hypothetical protein [Pectobacterium actinidiae]WEF13154.1 hypothetical protein M9782_07745 [Pectobacterium actinidiae]
MSLELIRGAKMVVKDRRVKRLRQGWRNPSVQGCIYSVFTIYQLPPLDEQNQARKRLSHLC